MSRDQAAGPGTDFKEPPWKELRVDLDGRRGEIESLAQ